MLCGRTEVLLYRKHLCIIQYITYLYKVYRLVHTLDIILDYVDKLMKNAIHYCLTDGKPTLPSVPPPLANAYEHPDKDTIPLFSRYKH